MNRKIELITVCKKYSDFLKITLPINKKYFDNVIVITDQEDIETQELCKKENVNFVIYDGFNKMNAKFNFGGARNFGIQNLKYCDWVIFLDSDIIIEDQNF
jgi:glycosyltransferase involved in cell wall biosynthesis